MSDHSEFMTWRQGSELAKRLIKLEKAQRSAARAAADLRHSAIDGGKGLVLKDDQGNEKYRLGTDENGVTAPQYKGGPTPEQPSEPFVDVGGEVVKIQHSGLDVDENPAPADFRRVQIHVSQDEVFEPSLSSLAGYLEEADGSFTHRLPGGEWYVGIVWETLSGKISVMSDTVLSDIPPLVDAQDIEDTLAEAEQIIADAVAEAQTQLDTLRDRLDNFQEFDPSDLIAQINQVTEDLSDARQEAAGLVSDLADQVDGIKIPDVSGFITQAEVDAAAGAAETAAKEHADLVAQGAKDDAIAEAETKANAAREAAELAAREYADQQDVIIKGEAAADAQTKADAAQNAAHLELTEYISGGANLLYNGSFEHGWDGWAATGGEIIESDDAHSGDHVVLIGSTGSNQYPRHDWIATEKGRVYLVEFWVKKLPGGDDPQYVRSYYQVTRRDGTLVGGYAWNLDQSSTYLAYTEDLPENEWVKLTALQEIAFDSAESVRFSPHFYRTGTQFHLDSVRVVDVTEAKTALDAAKAAQAKADEAHTEAGEAWDQADAAMTLAGEAKTDAIAHADNLPKMLGGSTAPTGTAPIGSVWFRRDSNNTVIGRWERIGGSWVQQEVSGELIDNLEAGKITALNTEFAESVVGKLWTQLAIVDRLIATSAWIGGAMIGEDAVEAKHITASESLSAKVAEFLKLSVADLTAGSAEIDDAVVNKFWAALAVIERLRTAEAWVTGDLVVGETISTRHLEVTESMVGKFAELLHLVVDRIDVNKLWADQTWQAAGHFGSSSADQSTLVDGTGLRITKHDHDNETSTDIVRLGGEGIGLVFSDEGGEITGALSHEGDASFRDTSVDRLTVGGRLLLPETDPAEFWDGNLWDSQPKGLLCFHEEDMRGQSINHAAYGFIEVSHHVRANRRYRVSISNVRLTGSGTYYGHFKYTLGDQPSAPHTESPRLGQSWFLRNTATSGVSAMNDHVFTPEHDGLIRILFVVEGASAGIEFAGVSGYNQVQMRLEDLGPNRTYTGMGRVAGHGGSGTIRDPKPLTGAITTKWDMTWYQNYSHNGTRRRSSSNNSGGYGASGLTQGRRQDLVSEGFWSSLFGFDASTSSTNPTDENVTLPAALNGAEIISMHLEVVNHYAWHPNGSTRYGFGYHAHPPGSYPSQYGGTTTIIGDQRLVVGATARIPLQISLVESAARSGGLKGFSLSTGATGHTYSGQISWNKRPKLVVTYKR